MFLVGISSVTVGFGAALRVKQTTFQLQQLRSALEWMQCELRYAMTPLPELCEKASKQTNGAIRTLFSHLRDQLLQQKPAEQAMRQAIATTKTLALPQDMQFLLLELGQTLGQFDLDGQLSMLEMEKKRVQLCLERYEKEQPLRCRSYQTLGFCAGAALIILMI